MLLFCYMPCCFVECSDNMWYKILWIWRFYTLEFVEFLGNEISNSPLPPGEEFTLKPLVVPMNGCTIFYPFEVEKLDFVKSFYYLGSCMHLNSSTKLFSEIFSQLIENFLHSIAYQCKPPTLFFTIRSKW